MMQKSYVLITAAKNEDKYIERTIKSVISQTIKPKRWVIVSDGSTDCTNEIVEKFATKYEFIELICLSADAERNFGSKARSIGLGYQSIKKLEFDCIGNLDADVSFGPLYYQALLREFEMNPALGIAGGARYDLYGRKFRMTVIPKNSVGGPVQFFRRECYEGIDGYIPLKYGGIDSVAETTARMRGWKVENFADVEFYHHRRTGSANSNFIRTGFRSGMKHYLLGYHPLFQTLLALRGIVRTRPFLLGGPLELLGYLWGLTRKDVRPVSAEFVNYLRSEQLYRIRTAFRTGKDPANNPLWTRHEASIK